jgi:hypothetical protein
MLAKLQGGQSIKDVQDLGTRRIGRIRAVTGPVMVRPRLDPDGAPDPQSDRLGGSEQPLIARLGFFGDRVDNP